MNIQGVGPMAGLAFVNPTMELYKMKLDQQRVQMEQQRQAYAVAKDLSEMFEVGKVYNKYDHGKQTQFANERIAYIGQYIQRNPDFMYDPAKYMKVKSSARELMDNKYTQRSDKYKENAKMYHDAVKANPLLLNTPSYQKMSQQLRLREETGSITGDDSETEFIYEPTITWDPKIEETVMNMASNIKTNLVMDPAQGMYRTVADEGEIKKFAQALLKGPGGEQFQAMYGANVTEELENLARNGVKTQIGDYDPTRWARLRMQEEELQLKKNEQKQVAAGNANNWKNHIVAAIDSGQAVAIPAPIIEELVGNSPLMGLLDPNTGVMQKAVDYNPAKVNWSGQAFPITNSDGATVLGVQGTYLMTPEQAFKMGVTSRSDVSTKDEGRGHINAKYRESRKFGANARVIKVSKETARDEQYMVEVTGFHPLYQDAPVLAMKYNQLTNEKSKHNPYDEGQYAPTLDPTKTSNVIRKRMADGREMQSEDGFNWTLPGNPTPTRMTMKEKQSDGSYKQVDVMLKNGSWYNAKTGNKVQ